MGKNEILAILSDYKNFAAEKYGILDIGVFGSVVRDEATDESDIDICIKTKTPAAFLLVHIKSDIEKLVNKHVDIVRVRDKMNPFLKNRIEKEALYV